jgi:pyruvate/2-oxoglutarate dehydrogenase complex dihydrolipoamide dehydrogenase (E3) component
LGIERLHGLVHFENVKTAQVTGEVVSVIKFRKAIIASGSQQRTHNEYSETMQVESIYSEVPSQKNLLIVGNTPSAIEAATFLSNTNNVSLWAEGNILSTFARGLVKLVERKLSKCITICKEKPGAEDFDHVILAGHRPPHTSSLQLEHAKVSCIDGFITIDDTCQTTNPKMYAVGECVGCQHSVALAISQARVAAESACGLDSHVDSTWIPQVAWSTPEIAQVGELDSNETISVKWGNSGLAVTLGCQDGVTMLVFDKESHAILGIGIAGTGATEMISEGVLALEMGATLYDLATVVRPHPTRSEMLSEAARIALTSL